MSKPPDKVRVMKQEFDDIGGKPGSETPYPEPIDPTEDMIQVAGIEFGNGGTLNSEVMIHRDGNNMVFEDKVAGSRTLNDLLTYVPVHSHAIAEVSGLQTALNAKSDTTHNHDAAYLKLAGGTLTGSLSLNAPTIEHRTSGSGIRVFRNLAEYRAGASVSSGAFVIETGISVTPGVPHQSVMGRVVVEGYLYTAPGTIRLEIMFYSYSSGGVLNFPTGVGYTSLSGRAFKVRLGRNTITNKMVIIIGDEAEDFPYPALFVPEFMASHTTTETMAQGWSISQQTDLTGYDTLTTVAHRTTLPDLRVDGNGAIYFNSNSRIYESGGLIIDSGVSSRPIRFAINGSEKARLHTNGFFGVGNTAPSEALDVTGNIRLSGQLKGANVADALILGGGTTARRRLISLYGAGGGYTSAYGFGLGPTNAEAMVEYYGGYSDHVNHGHRFMVGDGAGLTTLLQMKGGNASGDFTWRGNNIWHAGNLAFGDSNTNMARGDHNHDTLYQPLQASLTSISGLSGTTGLLRKTAANTYTLDTSTYLTGITSAQVTTALGFTPPPNTRKISNGSGLLGGGDLQADRTLSVDFGTSGTSNKVARDDHNHSTLYQPLQASLTSIAGLSGTTGLLRKTAANTYTLDTATYLTGITSAQVTTALGFTPPPNTRKVSTSTGLTGGGDLKADLTLSVDFGASGTSSKAARDDHSHAAATTTTPGFMSASDKTTLDSAVTTASNLAGGIGIFSAKSGSTLQFKGISSGHSAITVNNTTPISIGLNPGNIAHSSLSGSGNWITHANLDDHLEGGTSGDGNTVSTDWQHTFLRASMVEKNTGSVQMKPNEYSSAFKDWGLVYALSNKPRHSLPFNDDHLALLTVDASPGLETGGRGFIHQFGFPGTESGVDEEEVRAYFRSGTKTHDTWGTWKQILLEGDAASVLHTHPISQVTGLQGEINRIDQELANKVDNTHTHSSLYDNSGIFVRTTSRFDGTNVHMGQIADSSTVPAHYFYNQVKLSTNMTRPFFEVRNGSNSADTIFTIDRRGRAISALDGDLIGVAPFANASPLPSTWPLRSVQFGGLTNSSNGLSSLGEHGANIPYLLMAPPVSNTYNRYVQMAFAPNRIYHRSSTDSTGTGWGSWSQVAMTSDAPPVTILCLSYTPSLSMTTTMTGINDTRVLADLRNVQKIRISFNASARTGGTTTFQFGYSTNVTGSASTFVTIPGTVAYPSTGSPGFTAWADLPAAARTESTWLWVMISHSVAGNITFTTFKVEGI